MAFEGMLFAAMLEPATRSLGPLSFVAGALGERLAHSRHDSLAALIERSGS